MRCMFRAFAFVGGVFEVVEVVAGLARTVKSSFPVVEIFL